MTTINIPKPFGFSLAAARAFYAGFTPGSGMAAASVASPTNVGHAAFPEGMRRSIDDDFTLAFRLDRSFDAVAVALRERGDTITGEVAGTTDVAAVRKQISRILGLDVDGHAWLAVGERDPVVGRLQQRYAGFFTAAKASPYDAATWSIIAPRLNMKQAARIKMAIAESHGDAVTLAGRTHHVFPGPDALARIVELDSLSADKLERLRGIGEAAADGMLDADRLRAMDEHDALAELQTLRGVGPWAASHIYYRGAGVMDALPTAEPRVLHALGIAYGVEPSEDSYRRIGRAWRPFGMWVTILLMRDLARTAEWNAPHLGRERARAGRALTSSLRATTRRPPAPRGTLRSRHSSTSS